MTTLTINISESDKSFLSEISALVKKAGYDITITNDDDLTEEEFAMMADGYKEALLIKSGKIKATPASELWND